MLCHIAHYTSSPYCTSDFPCLADKFHEPQTPPKVLSLPRCPACPLLIRYWLSSSLLNESGGVLAGEVKQ